MAIIDWMAVEVSVWHQDPRSQYPVAGDRLAADGLIHILGPAAIHSAVEVVVDEQPGNDVAMSVLAYLKPSQARDECGQIVLKDPSVVRRRRATELLGRVSRADDAALLAQLLNDSDPEVCDRLASSIVSMAHRSDPVTLGPALEAMENHRETHIRRLAKRARVILRGEEPEED